MASALHLQVVARAGRAPAPKSKQAAKPAPKARPAPKGRTAPSKKQPSGGKGKEGKDNTAGARAGTGCSGALRRRPLRLAS